MKNIGNTATVEIRILLLAILILGILIFTNWIFALQGASLGFTNNKTGLLPQPKENLPFKEPSAPLLQPESFSTPEIEKNRYWGTMQLLEAKQKNGVILVDERPEFQPLLVRKKQLETEIEELKRENTGESLERARLLEEKKPLLLKEQRQKIQKEQERLLAEWNIQKDPKAANSATVLNVLYIPPDKISQISELPQGIRVYPNLPVYQFLDESVPLLNVDDVWKLTPDLKACISLNPNSPPPQPCLTGKGTTIGIIDTGIDYTHPDLGNCTQDEFLQKRCKKVIGGYDFADGDEDPIDDIGHGTHVAAIAAGKGLLKGVAPEASLVAFKVFSSDGHGCESCNVIYAINRSFDVDGDGYIYGIDPEELNPNDILDVINLSLGGLGNENSLMSIAVDEAVEQGVIAVVSAGNSGPYGNYYCRSLKYENGEHHSLNCSPASARKAIAVGAGFKKNYTGTYWGDLNPTVGKVTGFSSRGPGNKGWLKPDILAPGAFICAAEWGDWKAEYRCKDDRHIQISGTSMSAPHISGIAAILKQQHPNMDPLQIRSLLENTTVSRNNPLIQEGHGLADAQRAVVHRGWVPVINAELSTDFYANEPFTLSYSIDHAEKLTTVQVSRAVFSDYQFKESQLAWVPFYERTFEGNPPKTDSITIDFQNAESLGEAYRLTVSATGEKPFKEYLVLGNAFIQNNNYTPGWPREIETPEGSALESVSFGDFPNVSTPVVVGDIDTGDGTTPIDSFALDITGEPAFTLPGNERRHIEIEKSILFFDVDQDSKKELLVDQMLFDDDFTLLFNSPPPSKKIVISDLTSDGDYEIIKTNGYYYGYNNLTVFDISGNSTIIDNRTFGNSNLAVGDVFGDGAKDIVYSIKVSNNERLFAADFHLDGTFELRQIGPDKKYWLYKVLGDLDNDGVLELVATSFSSGWYLNIFENGILQESYPITCNSLRIGNMSEANDGLEIGCLTKLGEDHVTIAILDDQLNHVEPPIDIPNTPTLMGPTFLLYDAYSDGVLEIVYLAEDRLILFDALGNRLLEQPLSWYATGWDNLTQPVLGDFDKDGMLELLAHTVGGLLMGTATIYAWDLPLSYHESESNWLQDVYGRGYTNCYQCDS